ncbi:unnamed protein product [Ectocarpus sp. 8 AP-2014]
MVDGWPQRTCWVVRAAAVACVDLSVIGALFCPFWKGANLSQARRTQQRRNMSNRHPRQVKRARQGQEVVRTVGMKKPRHAWYDVRYAKARKNTFVCVCIDQHTLRSIIPGIVGVLF